MRKIENAIAPVSQLFESGGVLLGKYEPEDFIVPEISETIPLRPQQLTNPWALLQQQASLGIVGEIADRATRKSEADPTAVMGTSLAFGGAAFGRSRFMNVGDTPHHARLFAALVGASSR